MASFRQIRVRRRWRPGLIGRWLAAVIICGAAQVATGQDGGGDSPRSLVSAPEQLGRDVNGRPIVDGLPFVQPRRAVLAGHEADLDTLKAERDRVTESGRRARRVVDLPEPPPDQLQAEIDAAKRNP